MNCDDHAKKHGRHHSMIMARSWCGSHVFPTRECSKLPLIIVFDDQSKCVLLGLTSQRHSALISSDSEQFQVYFSAVHYLKISEQRWKRKFSELRFSLKQRCFSVDFLWNSDEQSCFLTDSECQLLVHFPIFRNFWKYLSCEVHKSEPQRTLRKFSYQYLGVQCFYGPKIYQKLESSGFVVLLKQQN